LVLKTEHRLRLDYRTDGDILDKTMTTTGIKTQADFVAFLDKTRDDPRFVVKELNNRLQWHFATDYFTELGFIGYWRKMYGHYARFGKIDTNEDNWHGPDPKTAYNWDNLLHVLLYAKLAFDPFMKGDIYRVLYTAVSQGLLDKDQLQLFFRIACISPDLLANDDHFNVFFNKVFGITVSAKDFSTQLERYVQKTLA
jgi:hypothetical protein